MSTEFSRGDYEQPPLDQAAIVQINLDNMTDLADAIARGVDNIEPKEVYFVSPDGQKTWELQSDCDPQNRAMLNKLYELSHADPSAATLIEYGARGIGIYHRRLDIPTDHGFRYVEDYIKDAPQNCERFAVRIAILDKPVDSRYIFTS